MYTQKRLDTDSLSGSVQQFQFCVVILIIIASNKYWHWCIFNRINHVDNTFSPLTTETKRKKPENVQWLLATEHDWMNRIGIFIEKGQTFVWRCAHSYYCVHFYDSHIIDSLFTQCHFDVCFLCNLSRSICLFPIEQLVSRRGWLYCMLFMCYHVIFATSPKPYLNFTNPMVCRITVHWFKLFDSNQSRRRTQIISEN